MDAVTSTVDDDVDDCGVAVVDDDIVVMTPVALRGDATPVGVVCGGCGCVPGDSGGEQDVCEAGAEGTSSGSVGIGAGGSPDPGEYPTGLNRDLGAEVSE